MRIQNNITAMNAHRQYSINNNNVAKSVAKLSSGYRINSAADDAAGLAISEKMRAQIRGLTMASKNSQDAVSLVQTAEGALQTTHDILQRMRELAVQSASDTNETTIDRAALQQEFSQLMAEIDDTADKTRFNDQNLIDGTFSLRNTAATYNGAGTVRTAANVQDGSYTATATYTASTTSVTKPGAVGTVDDSGLYSSKVFSVFDINVSGISPSGLVLADDDTVSISGVTVSGNSVEFKVTITATASNTSNVYTYTLDLDTLTASGDGIGDGIELNFDIATGSTAEDVAAALEKMGTAKIDNDVADFMKTELLSVSDASLTATSASTLQNGKYTLTAAHGSTSDGTAVTFTLKNDTTGVQVSTTIDITGSTGDTIELDFGQLGTITLELGADITGTNADAAVTAFSEAGKSFTITGGKDAVTTTTAASAKIAVTDSSDAQLYEVELKAGMTGYTIKDTGVTVVFSRALTADDLASESALNSFLGGLETDINVKTEDGKALIIQTGANEGDELAINIDKMDSGYLGIAASNISTQEGASKAITEVNSAINQVSTQRAALGALQNRLEFKIQNLDISAENLTAAESRIRDVDMAKEMTTFTKNNILSQAATAMLAQANALPQNVLQLLG